MFKNVPEDSRLEIKFVDRCHHYDQIMQWLKLHSAAFYMPYPSRQVNNVYFDTHDYQAFVENLSGVSQRSKVRYRWYGESIAPAEGVFEVKRKRNCYGWKQQTKIELAPHEKDASWRRIRDMIAKQLPASERCIMATNNLPVLINRYFRQYFVSRDGKVRITLDTQQRVWDQRFKALPNFTRETKVPETVVVEFKFDRQDSRFASQTIQGLPLRISRHSKYMNGVTAVCGFK